MSELEPLTEPPEEPEGDDQEAKGDLPGPEPDDDDDKAFFGGGTVRFPGSVRVEETFYAPGQVALKALEDVADSEFPQLATVPRD